jgi:LmbE family N-acetylglucosaminyl deacetylase
MTFPSILPTPDIFSAKRILCIQPHYDDNDIGAGGTLALLAERGTEISYLTVTDDLMGVVKGIPPSKALPALQRDRAAAGDIIGVKEQILLGFPDAGEYSQFAVRRELLKFFRMLKPDFVFTCDPWLAYEAHRDHYLTGLAAAEMSVLGGIARIPSSDAGVDAAYSRHEFKGVAFYMTREPNVFIDIDGVWEKKEAALRCYNAQFEPDEMDELIFGLDMKSRQFAEGQSCTRAEGLKVLHPAALHCGI